MKQRILAAKYIYTFLLFVIVGVAQAQSDDRGKLISLEKKRYEAMKNADTSFLKTLLADSMTYIHSSGVVDNKLSFIKDIGSRRIIYQFILPEKVTAYIDGNYGWVYGRANIRFKLATMTGTIDQYVSFVEVYQYKNYQWQMILCHNARIENNAPYFNATIPQAVTGHSPSIY